MNIIEKLLTTDIETLSEGLKKDFEITRLSKRLGIPFIVQCLPLNAEQMEHIVEVSNNKIADIKLNAILEGCRLEGKSINNPALLEKFNCLTGKELIEKLFLIGEISELYQIINEISGYSWVEHHKLPSEIYNLPEGEKTLLASFYLIEMERRNKNKNG